DRVPELRLRLRGRHLLAAVRARDPDRGLQRAARAAARGEGGTVSAVPRNRSGARRRRPPSLARTLTYIVLALTLVVSAFPIYWTFVVASSTNDVIADVPPPLVPGGHLVDNVRAVFDNDAASFTKALVNSAIVAGTVALSVLVFSSLAGFA